MYTLTKQNPIDTTQLRHVFQCLAWDSFSSRCVSVSCFPRLAPVSASGTRFMFSRPRQRWHVLISSSDWFIVLLPLLWLTEWNNFASISRLILARRFNDGHILLYSHVSGRENKESRLRWHRCLVDILSGGSTCAFIVVWKKKTSKQVKHNFKKKYYTS